MSRRNVAKKRFPKTDSKYNSYLVSLLVSRILKSGKKKLGRKSGSMTYLERVS